MAIKYRPEIDGLRAVAVGSVVLYHANPSIIPGGFVGVDIFFVISGYLITSIIMKDIRDERFTFKGFYERRARRILPALLVVVFATLLVAPHALMPSQFAHVPYEALSTVFFAANIYLWQQSGYFMPAAEEYPLLHMWSLGIEEQFYLIAPLVLWYLSSRWQKALVPVTIFLFLASLSLSIWQTPVRPSATFYLLPTRAWELLAGSLIALGCAPRIRNRSANEIAVAIGFGIILFSVFYLDNRMEFPGALALLPVSGAAIVIAYSSGTTISAALRARPVVFVGLLSYSLYLWHWPVLVLGRQSSLVSSQLETAVAVLMAFGLAFLTWLLVETPFRNRGSYLGQRLAPALTSGLLCVFLAIALGALGKEMLYSDREIRFDQARFDRSPVDDPKCVVNRGEVFDPTRLCRLGGEPPRIAVWGNSHAVEVAYALSEYRPIVKIAKHGCPAVPGFSPPDRSRCGEHNDLVLEFLLSTPELEVVLVATSYSQRWTDNRETKQAFLQGLQDLSANGKQVIVVGPTPSPGVDVPIALARGAEPTFDKSLFETRHRHALATLSELHFLDVVFPSDLFCSELTCTMLTREGNPTLYDAGHPSLSGAREIAAKIIGLL